MKDNLTAAVLAAAVCFVALVAGVVVLVIFAPEGADIGAILAQIFTGLAAMVAGATALLTRSNVKDMSRSVDYLANGGMDSKTRAGIADVVKPEFLRDDVDEQLVADRARRAAGPTATEPPR